MREVPGAAHGPDGDPPDCAAAAAAAAAAVEPLTDEGTNPLESAARRALGWGVVRSAADGEDGAAAGRVGGSLGCARGPTPTPTTPPKAAAAEAAGGVPVIGARPDGLRPGMEPGTCGDEDDDDGSGRAAAGEGVVGSEGAGRGGASDEYAGGVVSAPAFAPRDGAAAAGGASAGGAAGGVRRAAPWTAWSCGDDGAGATTATGTGEMERGEPAWDPPVHGEKASAGGGGGTGSVVGCDERAGRGGVDVAADDGAAGARATSIDCWRDGRCEPEACEPAGCGAYAGGDGVADAAAATQHAALAARLAAAAAGAPGRREDRGGGIPKAA